MERPTKEITLPLSKARIILFTYFTIGDKRKITRATLTGMEVSTSTGGLPTILGERIVDAEEVSFACIIKEAYDGETKVENITEFINNLPDSDGAVLREEINALNEGSSLTTEQKKK